MVIHGELETADHAQETWEVCTARLREPPAAVGEELVGDSVKEQSLPAWVTGNACPATVRTALRGVGSGLAGTL